MKISVLTPSFNSGKYLGRAVESVLRQNYTNWEHIIIDGASTDNTIEVLKQYPHLIWESSPDKGQSDAMNKAFEKSSGEIIIYLNADDTLSEGLLSNISTQFILHPEIDMVVGNLEVNDRGIKRIQPSSISLSDALDYGRYKWPLNSVAYAYRRSLQTRIGPFPVDNHYTMDYWFILHAFLFGKRLKQEIVYGTFYFDGNNKSAVERKGDLRALRDQFLLSHFSKAAFPFVKYNLVNFGLELRMLLSFFYRRLRAFANAKP